MKNIVEESLNDIANRDQTCTESNLRREINDRNATTYLIFFGLVFATVIIGTFCF